MMCPASMYLVAARTSGGTPDTPMAEIGDLASLLPGRTAAQTRYGLRSFKRSVSLLEAGRGGRHQGPGDDHDDPLRHAPKR